MRALDNSSMNFFDDSLPSIYRNNNNTCTILVESVTFRLNVFTNPSEIRSCPLFHNRFGTFTSLKNIQFFRVKNSFFATSTLAFS